MPLGIGEQTSAAKDGVDAETRDEIKLICPT